MLIDTERQALVTKAMDLTPGEMQRFWPLYREYRREDVNQREREANRLHRVLFHHLQSKFVAIAAGLSDFEAEFMPHLVITDHRGHARTLGEVWLLAYRKALESGANPDVQLWGDGRQ